MQENRTRINDFLGRLDDALNRDRRWLPILFIACFLLKLMYVLQSADALHVTVPIMDSEYYDRMARDILAGQIIRDQAFFMGPLYPYVLACIYAIFGKGMLAVRIIQILAGAAVVVLTYLIGRRVFRPSVALLGAISLALYGAITFYEGQLLMMWLGTLINMTMLYLLYRMNERPGIGKYAIVGFLIGLSALARANVLIFLPVLLVWILFVANEKRRLAGALVLIIAAAVAILPATIHNYLASRDVVPITSNGGVNFYIGNSEDATGIFYPPKGINLVTDSAVEEYVERLLARELKPSELSRYWFDEAFDFIKHNAGKEIVLLLRKTAMFFNGYEVPQIESYDIARQNYGSLRVLFLNFWVILTLALTGMIFLWKDWRKLFFLYGFLFSFSLSIILFFVTARYRVQVARILCLFAAQAVLVVLPRIIASVKRNLVPLMVFLAILALTRPGLFALPEEDVRWREHTHQARRLNKVGKHAEAIAEINQAIQIHPDYADSYIVRGLIYKEQGNTFKAIDDYSRALTIDSRLPVAHYDLAQMLRRAKMFEPAVQSYLAAIKLNPLMLEAYNNLGYTYRQMKQYEKSIEYFEKVIEKNPRYVKAYNNLGASLAESGELDRAIEAFQQATRIDPQYANSHKNLAMAYVQKGNVRGAYDSMERYLSLAPGDDRAKDVLDKLRTALEGDTLQTPQ
jgi:4-amino-4-deoxy-L-arabinose transferase-like glycosyltransferase